MIHASYLHDALRTTWAMRHTALQIMLATTPDDAKVAARRKLPQVRGQVAILPIHGVISQRASIWHDLFGGTSTEGLAAAYTQAVNDSRIEAVVFDVDSPGGTISGVEEAADIINTGSALKETVAVANSEAASAAYWLASQVGSGKKRFAAAPGAEVGSIGVYRMHEDISEMLAEEGVKVTFLAVPEHKVEANPYQPLSDEARDHHMGQVNATYGRFTAAVARGRGVSDAVVRERFGKGRMYDSREAADMGLVDRVATMGRVLSELGVNKTAKLTAAERQDATDTLCHAWEVGMPQQLTRWQDVVAERMRRKFRG